MEVQSSTIKLVEYPARELAYIRHTGPYMGDTELFTSLFNQVSEYMQKLNHFGPSTEAISMYHDDPKTVPVKDQRISVGFTVPIDSEGDGQVEILQIPAGRFVVGSFEIDPDGYAGAWETMYEYMDVNGIKPTNGIMYESYKNDPHKHPEGKHIVDICIGA